jgi:hypothetical protein
MNESRVTKILRIINQLEEETKHRDNFGKFLMRKTDDFLDDLEIFLNQCRKARR